MEKEAMFYGKHDDGRVECYLCPHNCLIADGKFGICSVRQNKGGVLYTHAYGNPIAVHVDPIEKKPLYHFLPGTRAYSIATKGCNFKCGFCQNWQISQIDDSEGNANHRRTPVRPPEIVAGAIRNGCQSIAYTYTEPTIFYEYAYDTAVLAHERDIKNVFVTNGYITEDPIAKISPYLDAANVDLKSFKGEYYKTLCKGRLEPVLSTIALMKSLDIWVEVTTLIIPDENDSDEELNDIAGFIAGVSTEIPWHISRFYPQYEFSGVSATPVTTLRRAEEIGKEHGLEHVYLGNV